MKDASTGDSETQGLSDPPGARSSWLQPAAGTKNDLFVRYLFLLGVALTVIVLDQIVKSLVSSNLQGGRIVDVFGGFVHLDYTSNTGAAFGMFKTGGSVFVVVAVLVSLGIIVYYRQVAKSPRLIRLGLGLVLGGAIGNLIDRVRLGYVIDFVDLGWWPVFNLSDSCIVVGVLLLVLHTLMAPAPVQAK